MNNSHSALCDEVGPAWQPLDLSWQADDEVLARRMRVALTLFVALGVALRVARYLLRFPLWGDECMLAVNYLDRGYLDLLRPLDHLQLGPILFLWIELTVVKLLGYSEWSLRLFPLLCGVGSVFVFRHLAGRLLGGVPLLLAVAIFSVAYGPIRHAAELKPYASDLLAALIVLALAVEWLRRPDQSRWLWGLIAASPIAVAVSYPVVFVLGGIGLTLLPPIWRSGSRQAWLLFAGFCLATLISFGALFLLVVRVQHAAYAPNGGLAYWSEGFPPLTQPLDLAVWLVNVHVSHMFAYPVGGERGASALTFICFAVGGAALWRHGDRKLLLLCLAPFAVGLLAAVLRRYPYGQSGRTMQYIAPSICLLAGLGGAALLARTKDRWRWAAVSALGLLLIGVGCGVRDLAKPFKTRFEQNHRAFASWFWKDKAHDAELVCVGSDLEADLFTNWRLISPDYLCLQRMYSAEHRHGPRPPDWDAVSKDRPLRCVVHSVPAAERDEAAYHRWLADMESRYDLVDYERHAINPGALGIYQHVYEVYEFVPKGTELGQGPERLRR